MHNLSVDFHYLCIMRKQATTNFSLINILCSEVFDTFNNVFPGSINFPGWPRVCEITLLRYVEDRKASFADEYFSKVNEIFRKQNETYLVQ